LIYFIDEDATAFGAWLLELELRGREVDTIANADAAFQMLCNMPADGERLVVIDVMLAVADPFSTQFPSERTDGSLETGLFLLRDLCEQNTQVFPHAAILLTNTTNDTTRRSAVTMSRNLRVPLWEKSTIYSPVDFADRVDARLAELSAGRPG